MSSQLLNSTSSNAINTNKACIGWRLVGYGNAYTYTVDKKEQLKLSFRPDGIYRFDGSKCQCYLCQREKDQKCH